MPKEGLSKIKTKLQELTTLIKEQTIEETQGVREDLLESVNEMKATVEDRFQDVGEKVSSNYQEAVSDLEAKALKMQYKIQEKYSKGVAQKDEIVVKTTDSLIDAINKMKAALHSKD